MEESRILKSITDTLTGKKVHQITVPVRWMPRVPFWKRMLNRKAAIETHKTFDIWPCIVANQYRIAGNAALLIEGLYEDHSLNIQFIKDNQPIVVYVVAAAIQNNHLEPEQELIDFISNNFDGEDLYTALQASFDNLGMQAFSNSIVLLKGTVQVLIPEQTSPNDGSESIASHTETSDLPVSTLDGAQT